MKRSFRRSWRLVVGATVTALVLALAAGVAYAADDTSVTINGGSLSITNVLVDDFTPITLDGTAQTTTAAIGNFSVTDARGTGAGWNVTVQATQFTTGGATPHLLPLDSLLMPQYTVAKADETSSAPPTLSTGPFLIDHGTAVKIASAAADGTGMGSYNFTSGGNLTLSIPASAYAGTYTSTVTFTVATGP